MIKTAVVGAAGRMGRRLVANICESNDLQLAGALEISNCPFIGHDAGTVAGVGETGVMITADAEKVFADCDAVINFSTAGVIENTRLAVKNNCSVTAKCAVN